MTILERTIIIGETNSYEGAFTEDHEQKDMTGLTGLLRLIHSDGATSEVRSTATGAQWAWTDRTKGTGTWAWLSNESFTTGTYTAEVWVYDATSPTNRYKMNEDEDPVEYTFKNPDTGVFT
jgi:hypothetical protein